MNNGDTVMNMYPITLVKEVSKNFNMAIPAENVPINVRKYASKVRSLARIVRSSAR
jgi:hypothetical protein